MKPDKRYARRLRERNKQGGKEKLKETPASEKITKKKVNERRRSSINKEWNVTASKMAKKTKNPIRMIVDGMKLTPNPMKSMIALSIGDPTTFGNLPPATSACQAVAEAIDSQKYNGYAPSTGYEFARQAVADKYSTTNSPYSASDVILTSGCSGAIDLCINVLANPGQNILLPKPGFSLYQCLADSMDIKCRYYDLKPDAGWEIDLFHLESLIDSGTKAILINNPSNPCGSVYSHEHLLDILRLASRYRLPIISDEIYADFVFSNAIFHHLADLTNQVPVLTCGGLTKRWLVPGWRMGWILIHDSGNVLKDIRKGLIALSMKLLGANTLIQGALSKILFDTPQDFFDNCIAVVQRNADVAFDHLAEIKGLKPIKPRGAMYMMIRIHMEDFPEYKDDTEFTEALVAEQSVFCLPASCFQYPNYFRIVLTLPEAKLREAIKRINEFCENHYNVEPPE